MAGFRGGRKIATSRPDSEAKHKKAAVAREPKTGIQPAHGPSRVLPAQGTVEGSRIG